MKRLAMLLAITMALLGCGGEESTPAQDGTAKVAEEKPIRIAVVPKALAHQFWLTVKAGAMAAGEEFGAEILWQGCAKETQVAEQINIVQDMLNSGIDGLVLAATDENALIQVVKEAANRGVAVVTIDSGVKSDVPLTFVATDNIAGAKAAADKLSELIGGSGAVGLIPFVPGSATSEMRESGFKEGLKKHPKLDLVKVLYSMSDVAKGMDVTQDMLTAHPDLRGIFAASEPGAIGAAQAIKAAGKSGEVKLVAFDAAEEQITALKEGSIQALIVQNPYNMGYLGVKAVMDALGGKPVEKIIDTGVTVVTMENFNDPEIQKLLYPL